MEIDRNNRRRDLPVRQPLLPQDSDKLLAVLEDWDAWRYGLSYCARGRRNGAAGWRGILDARHRSEAAALSPCCAEASSWRFSSCSAAPSAAPTSAICASISATERASLP